MDSIAKSFPVFKKNANKTTTVAGVIFVKNAWNNGTEPKTVDIEKLTALNKNKVGEAVVSFSEYLYGEDFCDRLIAVSPEDIKAAVAEKLKETAVEPKVGENGNIEYTVTDLDDVIDAYNEFGVYGRLLGLEYEQSLMVQSLGSNSEVKAFIAALQQNLDDLEAANEAAEKAMDEAYDAWYAATVKYEDGNTAAAELETANAYKTGLEAVLTQYKDAIVDYITAGEDGKTFYADLREAYVAETKAAVAEAEEKLYDAETALMQAEANLKAYKANEETIYEQAAKALEAAQVAYKAAVESYDAALEALNKKMADLSVE